MLNLDTSTSEAYGFNVGSSGTNNTLIMPGYVDTGYTFNWRYPDIPGGGGIDLRGFANVDVSANTYIGIISTDSGTQEYWWTGLDFDNTTLEHLNLGSTPADVRFKDSADFLEFLIRPRAGDQIIIEDQLRVRDLFSTGSLTVPGTTIDVQGLFTVTRDLSLRTGASNNSTWDLRILNSLRYSPRGGTNLRVLNFGRANNPTPALFEIILEDGFTPSGPPIYGVSLATWEYTFPEVLIRNNSTVADLQFIISATTTVHSLTTDKPTARDVTVDFNGATLRTRNANWHLGTLVNAPAGSELSMVSDGSPAVLTPPAAELAEVHHRAVDGLEITRDLVAAAYVQAWAGVGPLDTGGNDITTSGPVLITEGSINLATLPGTRFTCAGFTAAGVDLSALGTWYVDTTAAAPTASFLSLANSDASGSIGQGDATVQVASLGGNVNWNFGGAPLGATPPSGVLGLGLGLRLTTKG